MDILVETSARHIHLKESDYKELFGDKKPTEIKELSQKDVSCEETVEVVGEKLAIKNVRLLLPFRQNSQLELSKTDCFALGVDAPLKLSGETPGAMIKVVGPVGTIEKEIAIVAKRHLHLAPLEAQRLNLGDGDTVSVKIEGDRELIFSNIIVRVKDHFTTALHLDTDEVNAAGVSQNATGSLIINS